MADGDHFKPIVVRIESRLVVYPHLGNKETVLQPAVYNT